VDFLINRSKRYKAAGRTAPRSRYGPAGLAARGRSGEGRQRHQLNTEEKHMKREPEAALAGMMKAMKRGRHRPHCLPQDENGNQVAEIAKAVGQSKEWTAAALPRPDADVREAGAAVGKLFDLPTRRCLLLQQVALQRFACRPRFPPIR